MYSREWLIGEENRIQIFFETLHCFSSEVYESTSFRARDSVSFQSTLQLYICTITPRARALDSRRKCYFWTFQDILIFSLSLSLHSVVNGVTQMEFRNLSANENIVYYISLSSRWYAYELLIQFSDIYIFRAPKKKTSSMLSTANSNFSFRFCSKKFRFNFFVLYFSMLFNAAIICYADNLLLIVLLHLPFFFSISQSRSKLDY